MPRSVQLLFFFSFLFNLSCASSGSNPKSVDTSWSGNMQGLSSEVRGLVPYIYSKAHYSDPKNREVITEKLEQFDKSVHMIPEKQGRAMMGDDPLVQFSLNQLASDVDRAKSAFALGRTEYSRGVLKSAMNHCFRCHSSTSIGPKAKWTISNFKGLELNPVEKADLLVATRNFKEARVALKESVLNFDLAESKPFDYESVMKKYLALSLRSDMSKQERAEVVETFEKVEESKRIPAHLKSYISSWSQSLRQWKKTGAGSKSTVKQAVRMLGKGRSRQSYFKDHSGDVDFLRASKILHSSLAKAQSKKQKALVYLYLGETYEVLDELGYWGLHETYYETCVRVQPKSKLGRTCFERLRNSLYLGYTGSSGTHLPLSERKRLSELEKLVK